MVMVMLSPARRSVRLLLHDAVQIDGVMLADRWVMRSSNGARTMGDFWLPLSLAGEESASRGAETVETALAHKWDV